MTSHDAIAGKSPTAAGSSDRACRATMETRLLLHELPDDALTAILQRVSIDSLELLTNVPCRVLVTAASSDNVWAPKLSAVFGNSVAQKVMRSPRRTELLTQFSLEQESESVPESPLWLLELRRLVLLSEKKQDPVTQQSICTTDNETTKCLLTTAIAAWQSKPTCLTAFRILARLVPVSFADNTNFWALELSQDEADLDDKAHVLANFCRLAITKFWVSRQDRTFAGPRGMHGSRQDTVAAVVINWLTTPKNEENATLAASACRKFVHMFELRGVDLVRALRIFFLACLMPSQGRRMCRLLWAFAGAFYEQNGGYVSHSPRDLGKVTLCMHKAGKLPVCTVLSSELSSIFACSDIVVVNTWPGRKGLNGLLCNGIWPFEATNGERMVGFARRSIFAHHEPRHAQRRCGLSLLCRLLPPRL